MSLAYPGKSSALSDIVGRDAFSEALDDQALRFLVKEPKNLDDALNLASRLEAFDIMGSTGPEEEKSKSRFDRAAAGGKESAGSGEAKMSDEILKQLADLKGLLGSYWRDLKKQQQEIEMLKRSHQSPYHGNWNLPPAPRPAGAAWPEERCSFPEPAQVPRGPVRNGGGYRARSGPQPETLAGIVGKRPMGPRISSSRRVRKQAGGTSNSRWVSPYRHHWTEWSGGVPGLSN